MKTAVSIPDSVFKAADRLARRMGVSRSELYARALSELMRRQREEQLTEQLNQHYSRHPTPLDPAVRAQQRRVFRKEDW
jgi:hypothetical protein